MPVSDVIVIGCGGVGSAVLHHLARRGIQVRGFERFAPGHDRGSSHGQTRLIRQAYYEHPNYVPLLKRAYALWEELEQATGQALYRECGILEVSRPGGNVVPGVLRSAEEHGLEVEKLSSEEVDRRFPGFVVPEGFSAVFEQRAGFLYVEDCVAAHLARATQAGAVVQSEETVRSWTVENGTVTVVTDRDTYTAKSLVITAGAWARDLLAGIGVELEVVRKSLYWYATQGDDYRVDRGQPGFIFEAPEGNFYGFPTIDELGLKSAEHSGGHHLNDPLVVDRSEDPQETQRLRNFHARYLPRVQDQQMRFATCLYTLSPDRDFLLDQHPEYPQVSFAAGLSGHGFKFTSVLGEILADWAADGKTSHPVDFLGVSRFRR